MVSSGLSMILYLSPVTPPFSLSYIHCPPQSWIFLLSFTTAYFLVYFFSRSFSFGPSFRNANHLEVH